MNQDRLMKQGLLTEKQREQSQLEDRAENCISALQSSTFVFESALDLDADKITTAANDLAACIKQGSLVRARIEELKGALGIQ